MRHRRACIAIATGLGVLAGLLVDVSGGLLAGPSVAASAATATSGSVSGTVAARAGLSGGSTILWESSAEQARELDAIAATGAKWFELDVDWNHIQYEGPAAWHWNAATDRLVTAARSRGLTLIGMLAYSPPWARGADCPPGSLHCLPANPADFARFARGAVARYGANGSDPALRGAIEHWVVWNEPNHQPFAQPKPNLDRYTAVLRAAYPAIKAADPAATVVTGSTSPAGDAPDGTDVAPVTWLRGLYARGARGSFDAVGHHPYSFPTNPLEAHSWNAFTQTQDLYDVMVANGDGAKKIWGTEAGAPTGTSGNAVTETQQAQWARDYFAGWNTTFRQFTGPLIWFQARDSGANPAAWDENLGLLRRDWSAKPAYAALADVMRSGGTVGTSTIPSGVAAAAPGRGSASNPRGGYYVVAGDGSVRALGGAPYFGAPHFGANLARAIAVMPDGLGYVVLDGFGGAHKFGSAARGAVGRGRGPYFGWDIARDVVIAPDGLGYVVLDGFGGVHTVGSAPRFSLGYWRGWDIARAFAYTPSGRGAYMLDGFGGVHVSGDAVRRSTGYWRGWDIARDLSVTPSGNGYSVLDGFGGVHPSGDAPMVWLNAGYAPRDHAKGLAQVGSGYAIAG